VALDVQHLGRVDYTAAHALQQTLIQQRLADLSGVPDRLLLLEHDPVVTVGRSPRSEQRAELERSLAGTDCPVVEVERGGEATWHGPGQLVAYPIVHLAPGRRDLHEYLRMLEGVVIDTLHTFGVAGQREPGKTGVWVAQAGAMRKVASIGIAVRQWVTWHGVSLNVTNRLDHFQRFHPCGFDHNVMTTLASCLASSPPTLEQVTLAFEAEFGRAWNLFVGS
jgi:lipoyl(octanoyl) transferase